MFSNSCSLPIRRVSLIAVLLVSMCVLSPSVIATPIQYLAKISVSELRDISGLLTPEQFSLVTVGNLSFTVDSSVLATDGKSKAAKPTHVYFRAGHEVWDQDSSPVSFRGPCFSPDIKCSYEQAQIWGLFSEYWGFDVTNGKLVGLQGGIIGGGDATFVDFSGAYFSTVFKYFIPFENHAPQLMEARQFARGSWTFLQVPEPVTLILVLIALCGVGVTRQYVV